MSGFDLTDRLAVVTGSSRGIGFAIARALGEAGARVVVNGRQHTAAAAAADALRDAGIDATTSVFDVTDDEAVGRAIDEIEAGVGPIEILVNNAGIQRRGPFLDVAASTFRELIEVNLTAAFVVGQRVARHMSRRGHGKIVNVCSVQSELGRASIVPYAASKGGLKLLTRGMCAELAPLGIQVNGIAPGYFATELTQALVDDAAFSTWVAQRTPAGRWGHVDELGGVAVFLASDASSFVNGQIVYVDGGMTAVV